MALAYITKNYVTYSGHPVLLGQWNLGGYNGLGMWLDGGD
jgi:hypothetical protein